MPSCVIMFVCAVLESRIACLAILVIGVNMALALLAGKSVIDNLYSNLGIRTLLLMYTTWSTVNCLLRIAMVMVLISFFAISIWCL